MKKMRKKRSSRWGLASLLLSEGESAAYPDTWRTLGRVMHKEEPAFAQCCLLPLFSLPVQTSVAKLYSVVGVVVFLPHLFVPKAHFYKCNSFICIRYHFDFVCLVEAPVCWLYRVKTVPLGSLQRFREGHLLQQTVEKIIQFPMPLNKALKCVQNTKYSA